MPALTGWRVARIQNNRITGVSREEFESKAAAQYYVDTHSFGYRWRVIHPKDVDAALNESTIDLVRRWMQQNNPNVAHDADDAEKRLRAVARNLCKVLIPGRPLAAFLNTDEGMELLHEVIDARQDVRRISRSRLTTYEREEYERYCARGQYTLDNEHPMVKRAQDEMLARITELVHRAVEAGKAMEVAS